MTIENLNKILGSFIVPQKMYVSISVYTRYWICYLLLKSNANVNFHHARAHCKLILFFILYTLWQSMRKIDK